MAPALRSRVHRKIVPFLLCITALAPPLSAQEAGLLLGYAHADEYRTMWITMSADRAEVAGEVPDLIVPLATGFWRVGITTLCYEGGTRQVVWQTPLEQAPEVPGTPCPEPVPLDPTDPDAVERAAADGQAGCDASTATIHYVSPRWISEGFTFSQTEECEPRGGRWRDSSAVRRFDGRMPVSLRDLLGARAPESYASAVAREYEEISTEMRCPEPIPDAYDLTSWMVQHRRGAWRAMAAYNENVGDCALWGEMAPALPAGIAGSAGVAVAVDTAKLRDWVVSPGGRYLVALAKARQWEVDLEVWTVKAGRPDRRLLQRPVGSQTRVVVAEWATGRHVGEWTRVMRRVAERSR